MLKYLVPSLLLVNLAFAAKLSLDERRKKIIAIVDEELSEVSRLAKQQDYKSPDLILRMSELSLEKARLWRESENEQYLALDPEKRREVNRKDYFSKSTAYFRDANEAAEKVVKRFPKYKGLGDVYYILAYNNKELGNHEAAQRYFKLANSQPSTNTTLAAKSKLALADYHFNDHDYKDAIPLYEASLDKVDERWWTKDAFNLAWSYYRVKNYDKAIALLQEVHAKSGKDKYIDMRSQVERDIGVFYVDAGRLDDAVKFYEKLKLNYAEQFIKIASTIMTQGRFAQAESLLNQVEKTERDPQKRVAILVAQLSLFEKFNKIPRHLEICRELVAIHKKTPLEKAQFETLSYHVNKQAAQLQKTTASDLYDNVPAVQKEKSAQAIAYFELSAALAPGQKAEKVFFQGETAYAAKDFERAVSIYIQAFDLASASKDKKIMAQSLEGMLSSLGQPKFNPKAADKLYVPVYSRYLSSDPKSKRANSIFVKLFNAQYDAGDIPGAEKTMKEFAENFSSDYKTQEGMLAKIMEHYRKNKDYAKVKAYVASINSGDFKVSKKYADALRNLMTKIQIEGVQTSLKKGDKATALKGYHLIYDSGESTKKAKVNAAYNLSALYYELGNVNESYLWAVSALKDMEPAEVAKLSDSLLSISSGLFLRQNFAQSSDLSHRVLAKLCNQKNGNKVVAYKNSVYIALANGNLDKAVEIRNFGRECAIPEATISEVSFEVLKELSKAKRYEAYEKMIEELEKSPANHPALIKPLEDLRKELVSIGDMEEARAIAAKQNRYYQQGLQSKAEVPVEALDIMADRMIANVVEKKQRLDEVTLSFPEDQFNASVKQKLQLLDQLTSEVNAIQKTGSGKGIVTAYKYVIEAYEDFGSKLRAFVPEGKSPEYVASFQKAMSEVYEPILSNAQKQRSEIRKLIRENKILSAANYDVLFAGDERLKRYFTEKDSVLMEREGKR